MNTPASTLRQSAARTLIPLTRAYIRYSPFGWGKAACWSHVVTPFLGWRKFTATARTSFGSRIECNVEDLIQRYIYYFGEWEPNLTRWIARRLSRGDTFVDVGANIGYFSLLASALVGASGKVVAIEASPDTFVKLTRNLASNSAANVRAVNIAASDREHSLTLFSAYAANSGMMSTNPDWAELYGFKANCQIPAAPLATILDAREIQSARLIKIDVEGSEWSVIQGLLPILKSCRPELEVITEINPSVLERQGQTPETLIRTFRELGFHCYSIENSYSGLSYLEGAEGSRPKRLRSAVTGQSDVIFSRVEAESL